MNHCDRREILLALSDVDDVYIWDGDENDASPVLEKLCPYAFVHGGAVEKNMQVPEAATCERLGIKTLFNMGGGKIHSSTEFLAGL